VGYFPSERGSTLAKSIVAFSLTLAFVGSLPAQTSQSDFADRLSKNRYQLAVENGRLTGDGVPVLKSALEDAQFVMVGEDHGIAQIPPFYAGLCDTLGPAGFHIMAIETGPLAAAELEKWVRQADGWKQLAAFERQYPESIAFYNWSEEYDLLSHCAGTATGGPFHIWGLDQELMGSPRLLLTRILEQHPGPDAAREGQRLLKKNDDAHAAAVKSGSPGDMFMFAASEQELRHFRDLLRREGNAVSRSLIDALIESREIYQKNMNGSGFDSNRQRALLMKHTFFSDYRGAEQPDTKAPKVMFKFGAWHMFKGINPLHNSDLGNFVTELADGQGTRSVHIMILAVQGTQLRFAGIGRPFHPTPFNLAEDKDSDFLYLKPMFAAVQGDGMTMFDLRALRKGFSSLGTIDKEVERLIFGYDLLVLVPKATPSRGVD
jgi:hypothetical protein